MWNAHSSRWQSNDKWSSDTWGRGSGNESSSWWTQDRERASNYGSGSVPAPKPTYPASFRSDDTFIDSTAVGAGNHQFYRVVQPTDWSRKANLAGRPVEGIRLHEMCFRGMSEFSLLMLSEGRFQSVVWTRSAAEGMLATQLLKGIREAKLDIDSAAVESLKQAGSSVPDKHKQAPQFMAALVEALLKEIQSKIPKPVESTAEDELARAKAKLAQAGLMLTPQKNKVEEDEDVDQLRSDAAGSSQPPVVGKKTHAQEVSRLKRKAPDDVAARDEARALVKGKPKVSMKECRPSAVTNESVDKWLASLKAQYKGKYRELTKHVSHVVALLAEHSDKNELLAAAVAFGLDPNFAARMNVTNLSKCIAVAKFQAA
ncbi:unnamed protein product [Symbiodinium natans]|uniref:Uncharacterized protein n=1 Tax=Symbiodinium natans TaxID=878477 RepID=A0A812VBH3_9DINO|nr:unnamed protein product [Symbiodinium natans]